MEKNQYPCRQQELYVTASTAWNLFVLHIGDFTSFSKSYSTQLYEQRMHAIESAASKKDHYTLKKEQKMVRKELMKASKDVLYYFRCTKEFVNMAFSEAIAKTIISTMGQRHYTKVSNFDWSACETMVTGMTGILDDHKAALQENDTMPSEFYDECHTALNYFRQLHIKYRGLENGIRAENLGKMNLNNQIYHDLTLMLKHAQLIYRNRPDMQQFFRFDKLLKKARSKNTNVEKIKPKKSFSLLQRVAGMF